MGLVDEWAEIGQAGEVGEGLKDDVGIIAVVYRRIWRYGFAIDDGSMEF